MWFCSRSQGQPAGERSFAMTLSRLLIAEFFFFMLFIRKPRTESPWLRASRRLRKFQTPRQAHRRQGAAEILKDDQIVPMHHLDAFELARADFAGAESGDAAGELRSVEVADAHHFAVREPAFTARDAGRKQAFAFFPQRLLRAFVHKKGPFGMVKE